VSLSTRRARRAIDVRLRLQTTRWMRRSRATMTEPEPIPPSAAPLTYEAATALLEEIIKRLDSGEAGLRETLELCREARTLVELWPASSRPSAKGWRNCSSGGSSRGWRPARPGPEGDVARERGELLVGRDYRDRDRPQVGSVVLVRADDEDRATQGRC